ncbi:Ger(x)C family spore germination protein [Paenibacillus sp. BC26]|uniref:Ger(x)C family spore germination protein n=1 Tax=Paenibacillus sp. BC26 TaxID=1881032 RepID=UPI0008F0D470|nr:Ger(x)C family spore germination protein [Paenibacillus sp. BC26]SFS57479.1 spore germination protein [Paenibacillus sp. BC26]
MIRCFSLFLLTCFLLLLSGCVKQEVLEKITITFVCAFDEAPNEDIEFTIAAPKFHAGKSATVTNILYSKVGHTTKNITELMDMQLNRPIKPGKASIILFEQELAAKGLADQLDVVLRDPLASRRMYLAVVDGKAKALLQSNFSSDEEKGMFLFNLLDTNVRNGLVPRQNLHDFEYAYLGKGMDPFLPLIKLQNNQVMISGLALFKDDKYILSLNEKQMRVMKLLMENVKHGGILETKLDNGSYIALKNVGSKVNYRVGKDTQHPKVTINLNMNSELIDSRGIRLTLLEQQKMVESFEADITSTGMDLIQRCKKEGIDPFGLGDFVRSKTRNWNEAEWNQQYPTMDVKLNVKVMLSEMGIRK